MARKLINSNAARALSRTVRVHSQQMAAMQHTTFQMYGTTNGSKAKALMVATQNRLFQTKSIIHLVAGRLGL